MRAASRALRLRCDCASLALFPSVGPLRRLSASQVHSRGDAGNLSRRGPARHHPESARRDIATRTEHWNSGRKRKQKSNAHQQKAHGNPGDGASHSRIGKDGDGAAREVQVGSGRKKKKVGRSAASSRNLEIVSSCRHFSQNCMLWGFLFALKFIQSRDLRACLFCLHRRPRSAGILGAYHCSQFGTFCIR